MIQVDAVLVGEGGMVEYRVRLYQGGGGGYYCDFAILGGGRNTGGKCWIFVDYAMVRYQPLTGY